MKIIRLEETEEFKKDSTCIVREYDFLDKDIDCGIAIIHGRYPEKGYGMNTECKELIYIIEGNGKIHKEKEAINFKAGDAILIQKGEKYYWEGNCKLVMPCTPAWSQKQHKLLK